MKKAEMEESARQYDALLASARTAERHGLYRYAVDSAVRAWGHIDGMIQFKVRYENVSAPQVDAIDIVLTYAPLLFDFRRLNALEQLLNDRRRIEKTASESVIQKLANARQQMRDNHRLWTLLEREGSLAQVQLRKLLGGDQHYWQLLLDRWVAMGLVKSTTEDGLNRITLNTRMGQVVRAKCPECGKASEAPKGMFLESMACPACERVVSFVLLATAGDNRE